MRDSLSALDQAIACCGAKLNAAEVRALLGAFSLESLEQVTAGAGRQRFARACWKWWTNWSATARICSTSAASCRAISAICWSPASPAPIRAWSPPAPRSARNWREIAGGFSEEDLTRYLQLSLDIFSDLQTSLQPRFHLEIGLVRLVQAGRLMPIEEALAGLSPRACPATPQRLPPRRRSSAAPAPPPPRHAVPPRTGPSPFELDRAKKAGMRPPEPQSSGANALAPAARTRPP